ncbi:MAG: double zinc ribbon domain-containing protein [Akkermansia sp.]|nr:double zinc ribbon domain-containing protein [Akkermansia sp.]
MLRWLYPMICHLCHEKCELGLCPECMRSLPRVPKPICLYCGAPVAGEQADAFHCDACSDRPRSFSLARSAIRSSEESMLLIHALKYRKAAYIAPALAALMAEVWHATPELRELKNAAIVPVPITHRHLSKRGYNQAEELAKPLAAALHLPCLQPLIRHNTESDSQTRLSAAQRLHNAMAAYAAAPAYTSGKKQLPPDIVLIDDVYTTGATARACAKALKSIPGVKNVAVLTAIRVVLS